MFLHHPPFTLYSKVNGACVLMLSNTEIEVKEPAEPEQDKTVQMTVVQHSHKSKKNPVVDGFERSFMLLILDEDDFRTILNMDVPVENIWKNPDQTTVEKESEKPTKPAMEPEKLDQTTVEMDGWNVYTTKPKTSKKQTKHNIRSKCNNVTK
jgi:hypothetical protein